ncbi:MAG: hypothetical protein LBO63_02910 [Oscillospiraceae bacterium]|jgi:hypothetical protein|nr:hypothetical protein [Oscillospiraceae bacterium]
MTPINPNLSENTTSDGLPPNPAAPDSTAAPENSGVPSPARYRRPRPVASPRIVTETISTAPETAAQTPTDIDAAAVEVLSATEKSAEPEKISVGIKTTSRKRLLLRVLLPVAAITLLAVAVYSFYVFYTRPVVVPLLTIECGDALPGAESYFEPARLGKSTTYQIENISVADSSAVGSYAVLLTAGGRSYESVLAVADTTPPAATTVGVTLLSGEKAEPERFIADISDVSTVTAAFAEAPDFVSPGKKTVTLLLTDEYGNSAELAAELNVTSGSASVSVPYGVAEVNPADFFGSGVSCENAYFEKPPTEHDLSAPGTLSLRLINNNDAYNVTVVVYDNVPPAAKAADVSIWLTETADAKDFYSDLDDVSAVTARFAETPDWELAGAQAVTVVLTDSSGNSAEIAAKLTITADKAAPVIKGLHNLTVYKGDELDFPGADVSVTDNRDEKVALVVDYSAVDLNKLGTYPVTFSATDRAGNSVSKTISVTVRFDTAPPVFSGTANKTVDIGEKIAYRQNVTCRDKRDGEVEFSVDSSAVDVSKAGVYEATYTATDKAGNTAVKTITVTVVPPKDEFVADYAKKVVESLNLTGLTVEQKCLKLYNWLRSNMRYANVPDDEVVLAQYNAFTKHRGDCYTYAAAAQILLTSAGIENHWVRRIGGHTNHNWNMVLAEDGKWYFFDATPNKMHYDLHFFGDTLAQKITRSTGTRWSYFKYDKSLYPPVAD